MPGYARTAVHEVMLLIWRYIKKVWDRALFLRQSKLFVLNALHQCVFAPTVLWRIELDCSWWDCIDGTCLFLQTLLCASPIYAHPEVSADKPSSGWHKMERHLTPIFPFSPLPALMAAEARHIRHTCGLLPFCAVCGEMWPGSGAVGWCTAGGVMH